MKKRYKNMCIMSRSDRTASSSAEDDLVVPEDVPSNEGPVESSSTMLLGTQEEPRPAVRRRRSPLKPGLTARGEVRHFVHHQYHDHANDPFEVESNVESSPLDSFPVKLFKMMSEVESLGMADVVSWFPHGRAFGIHKRKTFAEHIMPKYFSQTKLTSFQRQLNLYGFTRISKGPDHGGYYHEKFLKSRLFLAKQICRTRVKGTKFKATSSPESEPDFYAMSFVTDTSVIPGLPSAVHLMSSSTTGNSNRNIRGKASVSTVPQRARVKKPSTMGDSNPYAMPSYNPEPHSSHYGMPSLSSEPHSAQHSPAMVDFNPNLRGGQSHPLPDRRETMDSLFPPLPDVSDHYPRNLTLPTQDPLAEDRAYSGLLDSRQDIHYDYANMSWNRPTETYLPTNLLPYSFTQHPMSASATDWDNFQRRQSLAFGRPSIGLMRRSQSHSFDHQADFELAYDDPFDELIKSLIRDDFMV